MIKPLLKDHTLNFIENQQQTVFEENIISSVPKFQELTKNRKQNYFEKSFRSQNSLKNNQKQSAALRQLNKTLEASFYKSDLQKYQKKLFQASKKPILQSKPKKIQNKSIINDILTEKVQSSFEKLRKFNKKFTERSIQAHQMGSSQKLRQRVNSSNITLKKLKNSVKYVKTLQSSLARSRSSSNNKKGIDCTLYEKSRQMKINQSTIKQNKKLITIKKKFQTAQNQWEVDHNTKLKEYNKIFKNNQSKNIEFSKTQTFSMARKKKATSNSSTNSKKFFFSSSKLKIKQNINSKQKFEENFSDLNKNVKLQQIAQYSFSNQGQKGNFKQKFNTVSLKIQQKQSKLCKKVYIDQKTQQTLDKIHEKYKFILNYLSDFDLIGKINGFQIAGVQECKWVLFIIDDAYEIIKQSQISKLKGIEHSRDYRFKTEYKSSSDCN